MVRQDLRCHRNADAYTNNHLSFTGHLTPQFSPIQPWRCQKFAAMQQAGSNVRSHA
jgi:hypothetical protein